MRFIMICLVVLASSLAHAQSYQDKKDNDAIALLERTLATLDKVPALFDGSKVPAGADLRAADELLHGLTLGLKVCASAFGDLSAKAAQRPQVAQLRAKYDELVRYRNAFAPALSSAASDADAAKRKQRDDHATAVAAAHKTCKAFRAEVGAHGSHVDSLIDLAAGNGGFWQSVEDGAKYKAALDHLGALCKRPAFVEVGKACELASNVRPKDADACTLPARADELMKRGVLNLVAHHVKHSGPTDVIARFEEHKGWLAMDGVTGYAAYLAGKQVRDVLEKRISPLLAQANMKPTDADELFGKLATEYAALEAKVRATAATWDLPGAACGGPGCAQAKKFVGQWYRGAAIKRFLETKSGWSILKNGLGVPTYRERYGFALIQVKGEPLCQLRMWTLSEPYAGGGRYTAASDVALGHVRWQTCR